MRWDALGSCVLWRDALFLSCCCSFVLSLPASYCSPRSSLVEWVLLKPLIVADVVLGARRVRSDL